MILDNRFYIAGKLGQDEAEVEHTSEVLIGRGYVNVYQWTQEIVSKPFRDHSAAAHAAAERMAKAVMHADIIVVILSERLLGGHIETGGALVAGIILQFIAGQKRKRILIVGDDSERSVFYFHHSVERYKTIADALETLPALA